MTSPKTLAERVADDLRADASAQGDAIAEFVLAADDLERHEDVYLQREARYDAALSALAKALGVEP